MTTPHDRSAEPDACYFSETLRERHLPCYVHDREAMLASDGLSCASENDEGGMWP